MYQVFSEKDISNNTVFRTREKTGYWSWIKLSRYHPNWNLTNNYFFSQHASEQDELEPNPAIRLDPGVEQIEYSLRYELFQMCNFARLINFYS